MPTLTFEGTVKIHGCCSSVRLEGGTRSPQSRNNDISIENDNYGFARFISETPDDAFLTLKDLFGDNVVVHGEWAGKGIQDTVAVSQLEKMWVIFAVQRITPDGDEEKWISLKDKDLTTLNHNRIYSIRQFGVETVDIDFEKPAEATNKINELSLAVESECPVGKFFGISGIGEGRVWRCVTEGWESSKFVFKVKGQAHSKSKVKKLANVDVEKMKSIEDFVELTVDEGRLQQGYDLLKNQHTTIDEKLTGDFLRWIVNDIKKEESDTMISNGLSEKETNPAISKKARRWFFEKINSDLGI